MEICGFHGVTAGMLVAVKQIVPDTEVTIFRLAKLRAKASTTAKNKIGQTMAPHLNDVATIGNAFVR